MKNGIPSAGGGTRAEHARMISCSCPESDRLTVLCISCGKVHAPDPTLAVLALAGAFIAAQAVRWLLP